MSSLLIVGFFALALGRRLSIKKPGAKTKTWYCYYTTTIQTSAGDILPADLRVYSPMNDIVHADNSVAFVIAKAYVPPNDTTFLDVLHLAICPGDPSSDGYEESLPDCPNPWIFGIGHVHSKAEDLADSTKLFTVAHSEYVRESFRNSSIVCAYAGDAPRWANTPAPLPQACIQYFGVCHSLLRNGHLRINVESILLSLAPIATQEQPSGPTPTKKRKFQAVASQATTSKICSSPILPVPTFPSMSNPFINASPTPLDPSSCMRNPTDNLASSSITAPPSTTASSGASSSMLVPLDIDINMHSQFEPALSPLSSIGGEADEAHPHAAPESSKAKGKKKAKY